MCSSIHECVVSWNCIWHDNHSQFPNNFYVHGCVVVDIFIICAIVYMQFGHVLGFRECFVRVDVFVVHDVWFVYLVDMKYEDNMWGFELVRFGMWWWVVKGCDEGQLLCMEDVL